MRTLKKFDEPNLRQLGERRDVYELAALDKRIEERGAMRALEAAREQPVAPAHRDDAELILRAIVVDCETAVRREALQNR